MRWLIIPGIIYLGILILVCLRIIYDTRNTTKTLSYLLLAIFIPVFGMLFYFAFGINYRKHKLYSKKITNDFALGEKIKETVLERSKETFEQGNRAVISNRELALLLVNDSYSTLTSGNAVKLLVNGEEKFPEVWQALKNARHHIHLEYYIIEEDETGKILEKLLIEKAQEGVEVRFIYDDFGSRSIRKGMAKRLRLAGVKAYPFNKIIFMALANRLNYRNHRKIIIIDGTTAFVGGINISDRYVNNRDNGGAQYWRDTHLRIDGPGVQYLQYLFICDWNYSAKDHLQPDTRLFPSPTTSVKGNKLVQIAASGPDSNTPTILYSLLQAINLATKEVLITTPYYIPGESLQNALVIAALSGVKVKLLVPGHSDSALVNAAARSYYDDLLKAGVEIYFYKKGFIHAKTMVTDRKVSMVGTANMDARSFDLNFEVNAVIYDEETAGELAKIFEADLENAEEVDPELWLKRGKAKKLVERTARLVSPLL